MTGERFDRDEAFWSKVEMSDISICWEWKAAKSAAGYGVIRKGDRSVLAHRHVLHLEGLDIPANMDAHHICQNRGCVNPDHLELLDISTHRGGHGRETGIALARLSADQVRHIRRRDMKQREYADLYGISREQISTVQNGRGYAWVTE